MPYFAPLWTSLDHLRITLCTCCIHYNNISLLYFICNDFSHFYYLLSQLFWFFKCYFLYYIYILWFTSFYHYAALVLPFCTGLCFFPLFFRSFDVEPLFSADNSFFAAQLYIGISPIILFKNLTLFMCRNLLVRHYYLSCLCLYRLSLCKNKYVSWSTTPIYSVLESILKRRFLHRKNLSTSYRRDHSQQQKEVSTHAAGEIFVSLFPLPPTHTILIQAPAFRCLCKERFLHRKNQL